MGEFRTLSTQQTDQHEFLDKNEDRKQVVPLMYLSFFIALKEI